MKTLVNKANPQIRITAPEITQWVESAYVVGRHLSETEDVRDIALVIPKKDWTLVEEGPTEGIKENLEEIPSNVGLDKAAEEYADKHGFRVPYDGSDKYYDDVDVKASLEGFKAGAKWMAEQMKGGSK